MNRKPNRQIAAAQLAEQKALLIALSDDLTLPLLQIKTSLELMDNQKYSKEAVELQSKVMAMSADTGLQLAEAYRLVLQSDKLHDLPLEPVSIGAVLEEVAHELSKYAHEYSTELQVDVQGKPIPALPAGAASGVLIADMLCSAMWQPLRAAAHKNMGGLAVGVPASRQLKFV
jgi:signal transduction histidine kinase